MDGFGYDEWLSFLAAIGGGLLVGIDRERHKAALARDVEPAGIRTFTIAALAGAVATLIGAAAVAIGMAAVAAMTTASHWRNAEHDPGLTTELALVVTFLLGALALPHPQLAAGLFVALAALLASKQALHRFTRQVLSDNEVEDLLLLAASVLIVLPLLPDRTVDPFDVLNPRKLWLYAVFVMGVNAVGYVLLRALDGGRGLALAGLLGGFVSSSATIAGMGQRARSNPQVRGACIAAALLSCVPTILQLIVILLVLAPDLLREMLLPLAAAGVTTFVVAGFFWWRSRGNRGEADEAIKGRPFSLWQALLFAAIVGSALIASALLRRWVGEGGVFAAAAAAGFADVHAAAVSLGQIAAGVGAHEASLALAAAFTTNSVVKCVGAMVGGRAYALPVIGGVIAIAAVLVLVAFFS